MGGAFDDLVPAAILFDNPGITLEGFRRKLSYVCPREIYSDVAFGKGDHVHDYFFNLFGLRINPDFDAERFLGLPFAESVFDPNPEDPLKFKKLEYIPRASKIRWKSPLYRVINYEGTIEDTSQTVTFRTLKSFELGNTVRFLGYEKDNSPYIYANGERLSFKDLNDITDLGFKINKILDKQEEREGNDELWKYVADVSRLVPFYGSKEYEGLKALVKDRPEFDPKQVVDYSPKEGILWTGHTFGYLALRWFRRGEGYFLDTSAFLKQKDNYRHHHEDFAYSSLILTSEAIKKKEWKFLGYGSGIHHALWDIEILVNHPSTIMRRANAILGFWDCKDAQMQGLTNSEWLRQRALHPEQRGLSREDALREVRITKADLSLYLPELREKARRREEYEKKAFAPQVIDKNENPF